MPSYRQQDERNQISVTKVPQINHILVTKHSNGTSCRVMPMYKARTDHNSIEDDNELRIGNQASMVKQIRGNSHYKVKSLVAQLIGT